MHLLEGTSSLDLLEKLVQQAIVLGYARGIKNGAMQGGAKRDMRPVHSELLRRLGVLQSPEITNRVVFMMLSHRRRQASCYWCNQKPPKGRGLEFWTKDLKDPQPLPLMMAHAMAPLADVEAAMLEHTIVLCRKCAKSRGAKLLTNGNVDLHQYDITII